MQEYTTVGETSFGEYEEKRSRFIAQLTHIISEAEASAVISAVCKKYHDARHSCYAYILKDGSARFSDDGEPHGTAGKPMLDVLSGSGIVDAVVVVTRYFGGVLLGTGGLVRAYSEAARQAVSVADRAVMCLCDFCSIRCGYSNLELLKKLIEEGGGIITDTRFTDEVNVLFTIKAADRKDFGDVITERFAGRLIIEDLEEKFAPFKIF